MPRFCCSGRACQLQDWRSTHKFECPNLQKSAALANSNGSQAAAQGANSKPPPPDPNEDAPVPQQILFPYQHYLQLSLNRSSCRKPPVGFTNLGNNCYANAALQCLLAIKPLRAYLDQGLHTSSCNKPHRSEWCLLCELQVSIGIQPPTAAAHMQSSELDRCSRHAVECAGTLPTMSSPCT